MIILLHTGFWVLLFFLPYLLRPSHDTAQQKNAAREAGYFYNYIINFTSWIAIFYFNSYFLLPRYLNRKRYGQYFLVLVPLLLFMFGVNWLNFHFFLPDAKFTMRGYIAFYFLPVLFILSVSTAITTFQKQLVAEKLARQRENANLKTELSFLRSQISPHFMFNVLNNMVALARKKSDLLEPSLFKLSSLLRYMLYETHEELVPLEKEIEYVRNYIDLQMQRFGSKVEVCTDFDVQNQNSMVTPMLLIPFVENAFKHGTGMRHKGEIKIKLDCSGESLDFLVSNQYDEYGGQQKDKDSGIGLQNVRRRLALLYPNKHKLSIKKHEGFFSVMLQLTL